MQKSPKKSFGYSNSQRNNMHRQHMNRDYGRKSCNDSRSPDFNSGWNITPINNHNRPRNFCNNNVSNLSFNEEDFMSSTAYQTRKNTAYQPRKWSKRKSWTQVERPYNNSFNDSSFTTKFSRNSKYKKVNKKNEVIKKNSISFEESFKKTGTTNNEPLKKIEINNKPLKKTETRSNGSLTKIATTSNRSSEKIKTTSNEPLKKTETRSNGPLKKIPTTSNRSSEKIKTTCNEPLKRTETTSNRPLKKIETVSNGKFRNIEASNRSLNKVEITRNRPLKKIKNSNQPLKKIETIHNGPKMKKSSVIFKQGEENFSKAMNDNAMNFIIDPEASTEDLGNNGMDKSDYVCKNNLKFPEVKISKLNLTELSSDNIELLKNMNSAKSSPKKQASPKKLFKPNSDRLVSSPNVVQMKKDVLCDELEICQDDVSSIQSESLSADIIGSSFTPELRKPKNKVADAIQEIKPKTSITQDKNIIVPSTQSQTGDFVHKGINTMIPDTQSQVLTPSLSIPCGQKRKETETNCLSPKKEPEDDAEHYLNSFFSQISPPTLSQVIDPIREPEMDSKLVNIVLNHPKLIPTSEPDNIVINNNVSISPDPVQSSPRISSLDIGNKLDALPCSSQNDDDEIVPSSQTDISSSSIVPNIQSLKLLSINISRRTSLESSLNESNNYSQSLAFVPDDTNNSYLGSTPPCTSTQIARKIKKFSLPDISPLVRNNFAEVISERFDSEQSLINNNIIKQELNTQPFQMESDNILEYNTLLNDSVIIDSQTRNFEAIKIKMESLFDVEASQCTQELDSLEASNIEQPNEESMMNFAEEPEENLGANENQEIISSVPNIDSPVAENKETLVHISQEHSKKKMLTNDESKEKNENQKIISSVPNIDPPEAENKETLVHISQEHSKKKRLANDKTKEKEGRVEKTIELKITVAEENVENESDGFVYRGSKNHCENNETTELEECNGKERQELNQSVEKKRNKRKEIDKENENPNYLKRKLIEDYDSKVEDVVRKIRDVCEKKKNRYLQHNIPTQFEIRIKDIEGTGMNKEIIEFTLQDDEEEFIRNTLSVSLKCKTGKDESEMSTQPFKVGKNNQTDEHQKNVENIKRKKEKKKKKDNQPNITGDNWWDVFTKDIPKSVFEPYEETPERTKKSSKLKDCVKNRAPEITPGTSKTRKLSEESETESISSVSRKKHKKSKKIKKATVEDLCDSEPENEASAPIELIVIADDLPEANDHKKKKKKRSKEEHSNHSDGESTKVIQDKKCKKELGKSLNKFYKTSRTLTPPFQFKKRESQPGKKWPLLSNFDFDVLGT